MSEAWCCVKLCWLRCFVWRWPCGLWFGVDLVVCGLLLTLCFAVYLVLCCWPCFSPSGHQLVHRRCDGEETAAVPLLLCPQRIRQSCERTVPVWYWTYSRLVWLRLALAASFCVYVTHHHCSWTNCHSALFRLCLLWIYVKWLGWDSQWAKLLSVHSFFFFLRVHARP